jgi:2,4-dienoyl-CoA reductase-like NADH-dependent reductase (Old Yellow Enzyme family)
VVLAGLGHAGSQGSSAYRRDGTPGGPLWAPSAVPDPVSREVPWAMDAAAIDAVVGGFGAAAARAADAGLAGVEVQAGQHALLRQFLSPLTNHRSDAYGRDRGLLLREVLAAVRAAVGDLVVGLRLAVDELAPWAGLVPDEVVVPAGVDYVVGVRGSGLSVAATRPDAHTAPGYGAPLAATLRAAPGEHLVVLAGGVVDALGQQYVDWAAERAREQILAEGTRELPILAARLGDDAGLLGAALAARECLAAAREPLAAAGD